MPLKFLIKTWSKHFSVNKGIENWEKEKYQNLLSEKFFS